MSIGHVWPALAIRDTSPAPGRKAPKKRGKPTRATDAQVHEMRWLWDFGGWSLQRLMSHYGYPYQYTYDIAVGVTRVGRIVRRDDFPPGFVPAQVRKDV